MPALTRSTRALTVGDAAPIVERMFVRGAILLLVAGCRQLAGLDTPLPSDGRPPRPGVLEVIETPGEITITSVDRFRLVFAESHRWQARAWFDLMWNPDQNLVNPDDPNNEITPQVLQSPGHVLIGNIPWQELWLATIVDFTVEYDSGHVVMVANLRWMDEGKVVEGRFQHHITAAGVWTVDATFTSMSGPLDLPLEIADAHPLPDAWIITNTNIGDIESYTFTLDAPSGVRPQFTAARPYDARIELRDDEPDNRYWRVMPTAHLAPSYQIQWTNTVWPPLL